MSGGDGTRRFVQTWWALAFILGSIAGAAGITLAGVSYTIWGIVGFGLPVVGLVAILEWLRARRGRSGMVRRRATQQIRANVGQPVYKTSKGKLQPRRGQLHAIAGRKTGDPPSSGSQP